MKTTYPATKARKEFFQLLKAAETPGRAITITVGGEPKVVMIPAEDFEGWMETLEIMSDKELMKDIRSAQEELKAGKLIPWKKAKKQLHLA